VEGLCHISEAGEDATTKLETGLEHVISKSSKINVEEKKVGLSLRASSGHEASRSQVESYKKESHKAPVSSSTIPWRPHSTCGRARRTKRANSKSFFLKQISSGHPKGWPLCVCGL